MTTTRPGRAVPLFAARGAATVAPEHTIPAYEAALTMGADGLWLPVHASADDQLVVIQDARLERTTDGRGAVREHTLRELKRLDAGGWFGRRFRGQRLQTLAEVLERFRDRATLVVELAAGSAFYPGIEDRLVSLLQIYAIEGRTPVASLDHPALHACRRIDPDVPTIGRVTGRLLAPAALGPREVVTAIGLPAGLATEADLRAVAAAGLGCYVEGVNDPAAALRFRAWGATGLVTDRPELLRPVLDGAAD
jgi:glycerophosphoryl diester phosphodiesterase